MIIIEYLCPYIYSILVKPITNIHSSQVSATKKLNKVQFLSEYVKC